MCHMQLELASSGITISLRYIYQYGIPKLTKLSTEMHCQICCKCMGNLQIDANAKHYQAKALTNANALSALLNAKCIVKLM